MWKDLIITTFLSQFALPLADESAWFAMLSFQSPHLYLATFLAIVVSVSAYLVNYGIGWLIGRDIELFRIEPRHYTRFQKACRMLLAPLLLVQWVPLLPMLTVIIGFSRMGWLPIFLYTVVGRCIYYGYYIYQAGVGG
jgi:membrane protein YqaA with SNARE-associated domain